MVYSVKYIGGKEKQHFSNSASNADNSNIDYYKPISHKSDDIRGKNL